MVIKGTELFGAQGNEICLQICFLEWKNKKHAETGVCFRVPLKRDSRKLQCDFIIHERG